MRTSPFVIAKRVLQRAIKPFEVPTKAHAMACVPLLGFMTSAMLVAPRVQMLGTILMTVRSSSSRSSSSSSSSTQQQHAARSTQQQQQQQQQHAACSRSSSKQSYA